LEFLVESRSDPHTIHGTKYFGQTKVTACTHKRMLVQQYVVLYLEENRRWRCISGIFIVWG